MLPPISDPMPQTEPAAEMRHASPPSASLMRDILLQNLGDVILNTLRHTFPNQQKMKEKFFTDTVLRFPHKRGFTLTFKTALIPCLSS